MSAQRADATRLRPYLRVSRWTPVVIGFALITVATLGTIAKLVVESSTSLTYEIHWTTTVPFVVLLLSVVLNGEWNKRRAQYS